MNYYNLTQANTDIHIEGFPDAVKVISLNDRKAKRMSDLALHKIDLDFAFECLNEINRLPSESHILRQALWRCAIIHFIKCFGNNERFQLAPKKIWKGNTLALTAFEYFKELRNKHVVHDENSYAKSLPGAILNKGDKPFKIEKIICLNVLAQTLEKNNYDNLILLIQTAIEWVSKEFDELCNMITKDLEDKPYEELINRKAIFYTVPTTDEIDKQRNIP